MTNEYKEWLKEQDVESLADDNLRMKIENLKLQKTIDDLNKKIEELLKRKGQCSC